MADIRTADAVACEINLRCLTDIRADHVIEIMAKEINRRSCSQIGTADSDDKQHFRILLDLLRSLLDSGELFLIVIDRQIDPAKEIIACSGLLQQSLSGLP